MHERVGISSQLRIGGDIVGAIEVVRQVWPLRHRDLQVAYDGGEIGAATAQCAAEQLLRNEGRTQRSVHAHQITHVRWVRSRSSDAGSGQPRPALNGIDENVCRLDVSVDEAPFVDVAYSLYHRDTNLQESRRV